MIARVYEPQTPISAFAVSYGLPLEEAEHRWDNVILECDRNHFRGLASSMSMSRGNFVLKCDHPDCDAEIDLETTNFDDAKEAANQYKEDNDWTTLRRGGSFADICGDHS